MIRLKYLYRNLIFIVLVVNITISCDVKNNWGVGNTSKINQLSVRLNSKYRRDFDKNNYSLGYDVKDEKTIVITMQYNHLADKDIVERVAGSAEDVVHRIAKDEYGLENVVVEIDIKKAENY